MEHNLLKTGTTTVGIMGKDLVVLAADKRATAGNLIVDKNIEKVMPVNEFLALTVSGSVSDLQLLVKYLKAELKLKELKTARRATVKEAANLLSGLNYSNIRKYSTIMGVCHFLFAGSDSSGQHLYDLYPDGSITKINPDRGFIASGSGSVFAFGVLEDSWKKDMSEKEAVELAFRSISSALQRDNASGEGVDVYVIDKNGVRKAAQKMLNQKLQ